NPGGSFTYTPNADFHGTDHFGYHAWDGALPSQVVTVTLSILPVNDPPLIASFTSDSPHCGNAGPDEIVTAKVAFTDPDLGDSHTATVSWGDSTPSETIKIASAAREFSAKHIYAFAGTYVARVTVSDNHG